MPRLNLVSFLVLNRIKPQAPLLVVPFRQSLYVSGLRPCSSENPELWFLNWTRRGLGWDRSQGIVFATGLQRPWKHHPNSHRLICTSSLLLLSFWSIPNVVPGILYPPTIEGKITRGALSLANPAVHIPLPSSACSIWCTSMSWELWARPPVLTPVPCRRTHSSQRPQNCLSGPCCLAFRDCRPSKDTQLQVHRHQQIQLRTCHCHWHKPKKQATSPLKFEPHMDRQCLIVCDPLTFVLDAPTKTH